MKVKRAKLFLLHCCYLRIIHRADYRAEITVAFFKLWTKTVKIMFWPIAQVPHGLLKFQCHFEFLGQFTLQQWRNRWGGQSAPRRLLTGKFLLTYREKGGENWEEKKENCKRCKIPTWKKAFHARKKNQEKWLCSLRKICLLRPCFTIHALFFEKRCSQ